MESGDWGFVHTQVQLDIVAQSGGVIQKEKATNIGTRMDLYSPLTVKCGEVKPYANGRGQGMGNYCT